MNLREQVLKVLEETHGDGMATLNLSEIADKIVDVVRIDTQTTAETDFVAPASPHTPAGYVFNLLDGDNLNFGHLRTTNAARCNTCYHPINSWSPTDWGCAVGGEAGELLNKVKKLRRLEDGLDKPYNVGVDRNLLMLAISKEAADTVIYTDLLMTRLGMSLGFAILTKFNETSDQYSFPAKFKLNPRVR
jgi:NTP pyrophosphatase (non-canonical NTP hydrolase)